MTSERERLTAALADLDTIGGYLADETAQLHEKQATLAARVRELDSQDPIEPPEPPVVEPPQPPIQVDDAWAYGLEGVDVVVEARVGEDPALALRQAVADSPNASIGVKYPAGRFPGLAMAVRSPHSELAIDARPVPEVRLVGPWVEGQAGQEPSTVLSLDGRQGDTVSVMNRDGRGPDAGFVLGLYGLKVEVAGRAGIFVNTQRPAHLVLRHVKFSDDAKAIENGNDIKWVKQLYDCSVDSFDEVIDCPSVREHGYYWHAMGRRATTIRKLRVRAVGGQALQLTERPIDGSTSPVQDFLLEDSIIEGTARNIGRAGSALTFAGAGARVFLNRVIVRDLDPNDTPGAAGTQYEGTNFGGLTTWVPLREGQWDATDPTQGGWPNPSLTIRDSIFEITNGNRELCKLSACGLVDVQGSTFHGREVVVGHAEMGVGRLIWKGNAGTSQLVTMPEGVSDPRRGTRRDIGGEYDLERLGMLPAGV